VHSEKRPIHRTEIRQEDVFRKLPKGHWVVWWYGATQKNPKAQSLPTVVLWFRELLADGTFGAVFERVDVGIDLLGLAQIGTIWSDGESESQLAYSAPVTFDIDFSPGHWHLTSQVEHQKAPGSDLIPFADYRLKYSSADRSKVLVFRLKDGRELLVPALEFFSRRYGRSGEVNRVLATYGWNEAKPRLCERGSANVPPGHWGIKLGERCRNDDAIFLAHVEHDLYAERAAKRVYASLQIDYNKLPDGRGLAFPEIGPWFQGPAKLKVEGIPLDEGRRFLALRILGGSQPKGPPILAWREHQGKAENQAPDDASESGWRGPDLSPRRPGPLPKITSADEPDRDSETVDIKTPAFEVIGVERDVAYQRSEDAQTRPGPPKPAQKADRYSGGERHGSSRGTGLASIHTQTVLESNGAQRDVWDALQLLHAQAPQIIRAVGWFNAQSGGVTFAIGDPCLATLRPLEPDEQPDLPPAKRNWVFLEKEPPALRGVLVACADTPQGRAFLFEVERKRGAQPTDGTAPEEEKFCGLVVLPRPDFAPREWIPRVLDGIRNARGIMANVLAYCPPGKRDYYRRSNSKTDKLAGHSTVLGALSKVGIDVPRAE